MKKIGILLFTFALSLTASAGGFYQQLCSFNFNWKNYAQRAPEGPMRAFSSDKEYVQAHLGAVLGILRSNPVEQLNTAQRARRTELIAVLAKYRQAGVFPANDYRCERLPVFIDDHGTHCAVGFLMRYTGHEALALRIAAANNYAWVKDITDLELGPWQQASGFTVDELKLIQGAYDSYLPYALTLPNKYEIPQKPNVMLAYFQDERTGKALKNVPENLWLKGEGDGGILNGKWTQNFAVGVPWIVGWFEKGKKSGQWKEYYQGTTQLCRTEIWRNDKLNGLRIRYDRNGKVIEEILFREGKVVTKTNYSLGDSLTWIRRPLNDSMLYAEVYNSLGALIATGKEKVYNPGNLQWFQNIELTALNTAAIQASSPVEYVTDLTGSGQSSVSQRQSIQRRPHGRVELFGGPQLVQYLKEGTWTYYKEYNYTAGNYQGSLHRSLTANYKHFAPTLIASLSMFEDMPMTVHQDSILVEYMNDQVLNFYAPSANNYAQLKVNYYAKSEINIWELTYRSSYYRQRNAGLLVKDCGVYTTKGERTGEWRYFTNDGQLYKKENYLIAWKDDN